MSKLSLKDVLLGIAIVFIVFSGALVTYYLWPPHKDIDKNVVASAKPNITSQLKTTNNIVVPKSLIKKARAAGYYCPSWNAQPGQIVSSICYPLNN
jgi:regulatory protein YycH of two-component signal transduction system YycFG